MSLMSFLGAKPITIRKNVVSITQQKQLQSLCSLKVKKNPLQEKFSELRISSHKRRVETGRAYQIPGKERTCTLCDRNRIKNLLLLDCTSYPAIRDVFFSKMELKIPVTHKIIMEFKYHKLAHVQFYERCLEFSTKTSNLRVNHLLTMINFQLGLREISLASSSDLKKNTVFANICFRAVKCR